MTNPWRLSPRECEVLDALLLHGHNKAISKRLGIAASTITLHIRHASLKAGVTHRVAMAILWDRFKREAQ